MVTNRDGKSFGLQREIPKICSDDRNRWRFWSVFRHSRTHFAENFRMSKCSWMMDPTRSGEMARGASRVEVLPRLNWATQFLTVEFNVAFTIMFLSDCSEFSSAFCFAWKKNLTSALMKLRQRTVWQMGEICSSSTYFPLTSSQPFLALKTTHRERTFDSFKHLRKKESVHCTMQNMAFV